MSSSSLEVIVKTCDIKNMHPSDEDRFCKTDKHTLIKKCLSSLIIACNNRPQRTSITVIDDNSSDECVKSIKTILSKSFHKTQLIHREKNDYNEATLQYFKQGRDSARALVYCVEDDYLHYPEAINEMCWFYEHSFKQLNGEKDIALHPFDDPDNYYSRYMVQSYIVLGQQRHWRTNYYTTCTFLTTPGVIRRNWEHFEKFALNYGKDKDIHENSTINKAWAQKEVQLFSPITSLALHMQFQQNIDPRSDWQSLWNLIPDMA